MLYVRMHWKTPTAKIAAIEAMTLVLGDASCKAVGDSFGFWATRKQWLAIRRVFIV